MKIESRLCGAELPAKMSVLAALLVVAAVAAPWSGASAHTYKFRTLYSFCAEANCPDGDSPRAGLLMDQQGNLYGTTLYYGASGQSQGGTVFELLPNGKRWKHKTLYSFCAQTNCADGYYPVAGLIVDTSGNLYGTAEAGGPYNNAGVVFELLPKDRNWKYRQLHAFCAQAPCSNGSNPIGGLTYAGAASGQHYDGVSPLFGNASKGGANGGGVAFKLEPQNRGWKETVLYNFCSSPNCADGSYPSASPVMDSAGRLFGTTASGGSNGQGAVYSLTGNNESVTYSFCPVSGCADGSEPLAPVLLDNEGHIFGTTNRGGAQDKGVLFAIVGSDEQVLHSFCSEADCADGASPQAGVIENAAGHLFGTTFYGHNNNDVEGVVYEFSGGTERVLHTSCSEAQCTDGGEPGGLIMDAAGNLYGTTGWGGANGDGGTVFELEY